MSSDKNSRFQESGFKVFDFGFGFWVTDLCILDLGPWVLDNWVQVRFLGFELLDSGLVYGFRTFEFRFGL